MSKQETEASESVALGVLRSLYGGRSGDVARMGLIALAALVGGFAEAGFLVVVTKTGLAATSGAKSVGLVGGLETSVRSSLGLAGALLLCRVLAGVLGGRLSSANTSKTVARVRKDLAGAYLRAEWGTQQAAGIGQLQDLLTSFTDKIQQLLNALATIITSGLNLAALLLLSVAVEPVATLLVVVVVVALGSLLRPVRAAIRRRASDASGLNLEFAGSLSEASDLGMEYHIFNVQYAAEEKIGDIVDKVERTNRSLGFSQSLIPTIYTGLAYMAVLIALAGIVAYSGSEIGAVGAVMIIMLRSLGYGQGLQVAQSSFQSTLPYCESLNLKRASFIAASRPSGGIYIDCINVIELDDVSFEYTPDTPVLRNLSFALGPREVVGIVGPSGGGKSTLVQVILGLRRPTSGRVLLDGEDLQNVARESLARRMTFVPQEPHLFNGSIEDNVRFMREGVTSEEIEQACRASNFWSDIESFEEGLQRNVGDRGSQLSGGQRQRLCIARALVERPDVLVLDEPTSALDVHSELLIRETLVELSRSMSVVIIAHRLSTLDFCDRIMVVNSGRIDAFDSAETLERENAFYREALSIAGMRPDSFGSASILE